MITMKGSMYKSYDELPLFLKLRAPAGTQRSGSGGKRRRSKMSEFSPLGGNEGYGACADEVAKTLGVSPSTGYELMHEKDFPALRIGSRIVVPKEKFREWVERNTGGAN